MGKTYEALVAFRKRVAHVLDNVKKDAETLSEFSSRANNQLDDLMEYFVEAQALTAHKTFETSAQSQAPSSKLSFLSSKTIPVDAYKIRNSLYLTQPLRSPPQAAINVIEREDVAKMQ